jgi:hypothetical protein
MRPGHSVRQGDAGNRQTVYTCATYFDKSVQVAFSGYVQLRHHEVGERTGRADNLVTSRGVNVTDRQGTGP